MSALRSWVVSIPDEPGPEVTHVADRLGQHWERSRKLWRCMTRHYALHHWTILVHRWGRLVDVSNEYK